MLVSALIHCEEDLMFMRLILLAVLGVFSSAALSEQARYFDQLYKLMSEDERIEQGEDRERFDLRNKAIVKGCKDLNYLPTPWKEAFSRRYKLNIESVRFFGTYLVGSEAYPSCIIKSSSDRGVCTHSVFFSYREPFSISRIETECG